jgi:predicted outer membrane repeat protein
MFTQRPVSIIGDGPAEAVSLKMKFGFNECDGLLLENVTMHDISGSAIYIWSGTYTIRSCRFEGNSDPWGGGAIQCYMGDLIVEDSVFKGNRANSFGGAIMGGTTLTLRRCIFRGNEAGSSGGAVYLPARGSVENCMFLGNRAPQASAIETSMGILKGSTFYGNDCLDASNYGAAVKITGDWVGDTPDHCIIAGTIRGFGLWCSGIGIAQCTDFWDNDLGSDPGGLYCDIDPEKGNFYDDPLLCDPDHGDFGLSENSPCLPGNHDGFDCGMIGAGAEHCGIVPVKDVTWGKLRFLFR